MLSNADGGACVWHVRMAASAYWAGAPPFAGIKYSSFGAREGEWEWVELVCCSVVSMFSPMGDYRAVRARISAAAFTHLLQLLFVLDPFISHGTNLLKTKHWTEHHIRIKSVCHNINLKQNTYKWICNWVLREWMATPPRTCLELFSPTWGKRPPTAARRTPDR